MGRETLGIDGGTIKGGSGTRIRLGLQGSGADMAERRKEGARDFRREVGEGSARWDRAVSGTWARARLSARRRERREARPWAGLLAQVEGRARAAAGPTLAQAGRAAPSWARPAAWSGLVAPLFFFFSFSEFF